MVLVLKIFVSIIKVMGVGNGVGAVRSCGEQGMGRRSVPGCKGAINAKALVVKVSLMLNFVISF